MSPSKADRLFVFWATGLGLSSVPARLTARFSSAHTHQSLHERKVTGAGLIGSIEGALTYLFLPAALARSWWLPLLGIALSVWISDRAEAALNSHDDSRIVIDEWIGAWIALWGLDQRINHYFILAFVFFRVFDVMKGPLGRVLQRLRGGWGVTADDVYAGIAANLLWRFSVEMFGRFAH
jgi:phosphatidylglycerophosphatase A